VNKRDAPFSIYKATIESPCSGFAANGIVQGSRFH
jgi:hypothetical protein